MSNLAAEALKAAVELRKLGFTGRFYGSDGIYGPDSLLAGGVAAAVEGMQLTTLFSGTPVFRQV